MAVKVGSIFIDMRANVARFSQQMRSVRRSARRAFGGIASAARRAVSAVLSFKTALVGAAGLAGIGYMIKQSLAFQDNMAKTARNVGITVELLSKLKHAAGIAGVSQGQLTSAMGQFVKRIGELKAGTGEMTTALGALDAELLAGLRASESQEEALLQVAEALKKAESAADRARIATAAFGRGGIPMIEMLRGGSAAMQDLFTDAERLGAVLSTRATAGVERANDAVTRLVTLFRGVRDQITGALAPAIETLANFITGTLTDSIKNSGKTIEGWARGVAVKILEMMRTIAEAIDVMFQRMNYFINNTLYAMGKISEDAWLKNMESDLSGLSALFTDMIAAVKKFGAGLDVPKLKARAIGAAADETKEKIKALDTTAQEFGSAFTSSIEGAITGTDRLIDSIKKLGLSIANIALKKAVLDPIGASVGGFFKNLLGFADGGSFTVGGGGGTDSRLVAFRATPGETVSIRTPAQQRLGGGGGGGGAVLNIDARGADVGTVARIEAVVRQHLGGHDGLVLNTVADASQRGGGFAHAIGR